MSWSRHVGAPRDEILRADVPGATPTGGHFSIHFPIPYTDAKLEADDPGQNPAVVYMVTGMNSEMIMLTATETVAAGQPPKTLTDLVDIMKQRPGGTVADVKDDNKDGKEMLTFSARDDKHSYYFRYVSAGNALYSQVIEFPEYERPEAAAMNDHDVLLQDQFPNEHIITFRNIDAGERIERAARRDAMNAGHRVARFHGKIAAAAQLAPHFDQVILRPF